MSSQDLFMFPVQRNADCQRQLGSTAELFHVACGTSGMRRLDRRLSPQKRLDMARRLFRELSNRHIYAGFIISTINGRPEGFALTRKCFHHEFFE